MEGGLTMLWHSIIISLIFYVIFKYLVKTSYSKSVNRSLLIGSISLIYMILFGHKLPIKLNKNI